MASRSCTHRRTPAHTIRVSTRRINAITPQNKGQCCLHCHLCGRHSSKTLNWTAISRSLFLQVSAGCRGLQRGSGLICICACFVRKVSAELRSYSVWQVELSGFLYGSDFCIGSLDLRSQREATTQPVGHSPTCTPEGTDLRLWCLGSISACTCRQLSLTAKATTGHPVWPCGALCAYHTPFA